MSHYLYLSWKPEKSLDYFLCECRRKKISVREIRLFELDDVDGSHGGFIRSFANDHLPKIHRWPFDWLLRRLFGKRGFYGAGSLLNDRSVVLYRVEHGRDLVTDGNISIASSPKKL